MTNNDKIYKISKSTTEVYSKQGGTKVVKFETEEVSAKTLKEIVRRYNYSACRWLSGNKKGPRFIPDTEQTGIGHCSNDSFAEMFGIILDVDEGLTIIEAKTTFKDYKGCIFPSSSHQQEKVYGDSVAPACDRFRIFLPFNPDEFIVDVKTARDITKAALSRWPFADQSCVDPARKYFPTTGEAAEDSKFVFKELEGTRYLSPGELTSFISVGNILDSEQEDKKASKELKKHNDKVPTFSLDDFLYDEEKKIVTVKDLLELDQEVNVFCNFCDDINSMSRSAVFYPTNWKGIPSIFCQHCKSVGDGYNKNGLFYLNDDEAFDLVVKRTGNVAFIDKDTNKVFFGAHDQFLESYSIDQRDFRTIKNALSTHHMPMPKVLPEVRYKLKPDSDKIVALEEGFVNRYIAPAVLRERPVKGKKYPMPKYTGLLLEHLFPDGDLRAHFINWLSCITQLRKKIITTFILRGVQGTGKNLLYDFLIKNIFGKLYCTEVHQNKFLSQFNTFIPRSVWVLVNEVEIDFNNVKSKGELAAKLKPFITDEMLEAEAKGQDSKPEKNNCNALFFSNKRRSVQLETSDRRFNVCDYVEIPIKECDWWPGPSITEILLSEVRDFCMFLKTYPIDIARAEYIYKNVARRDLIELGQTITDTFFQKVKEEDFEWMMYSLTEETRYNFPGIEQLQLIIENMMQKGYATRDDLRTIFQNIAWTTGVTPQKFTMKCKDHGLELQRKTIDGVRSFIKPFETIIPTSTVEELLPLD